MGIFLSGVCMFSGNAEFPFMDDHAGKKFHWHARNFRIFAFGKLLLLYVAWSFWVVINLPLFRFYDFQLSHQKNQNAYLV